MSTTTTNKPPTSCKVCKKKRNGYWCIPCNRERFRQEFSLWTSGNKHIDDFIQTAQLEATRFEHVIEWIPFDRFENVEFIAEGGFGKIYKAKWKDGQISGSNPLKPLDWWRKSPYVVALKSLNNSKDIGEGFLDELKSHLRCIRNAGDSYSMVPLYGITQNIESEEKNYMMVTLFADKGSMRDYMKNNLSELVWSSILINLKLISKGLLDLHNSGLIHRDFHSGNILFEGQLKYIADFGLSKPADSDPNDYKVYGILPYVAPELLGDERGKAYTQASDIYSFGILMWEVVTCVPPYKDESYLGNELRFQIIKGRRPEIDDEFPECYAQLMKQCWSENPDERPTAEELHNKISEFQIGYAGYDFLDYNPIYKDIFTKAQIKRKKFLEAVYKIENNIDLIEDVKKDLDDRDYDTKYFNKHVDRYFSPPHPEAYTKSRLLSNLNDYRQSKVKKEISEVVKTLESLTVNNFNSGIIDISFDDE